MCPDGINGKNISSLNLADRVSQDKVHSFFVFLRADLFKCGASCVLKNLFPWLLPLAGSAWPTLWLPGTAASGSPPDGERVSPPPSAHSCGRPRALQQGEGRGEGLCTQKVLTDARYVRRMTSGREELGSSLSGLRLSLWKTGHWPCSWGPRRPTSWETPASALPVQSGGVRVHPRSESAPAGGRPGEA